jgi:nucleoside phosphorylase
MNYSTGIVVALPHELKTLGYRKVPKNGLIYHSGQVVIYLSGIGKENAMIASEKLVQKGASCLLSWGTAAALTEDITPGTIVIPKEIITEKRESIHTDSQLRNILLNHLPLKGPVESAPLCETGGLLWNEAQKLSLSKRTHAKTADMESAAVAIIAKKFDIPFMAIRSVSDSSKMSIPPSVSSNMKGGTTDIMGIVKQAIMTPNDWLPMIKLYYNFTKAQKSLRSVANALLPYLEHHHKHQ